MTTELLTKTFTKAVSDLNALLTENMEAIKTAIAQKLENTQDNGGKVKVPIAASITLAPMGDSCGVKVKISFGEKIKDESEATVDMDEGLGIK